MLELRIATARQPLRRLVRVFEPWYNWGSIDIERMEEIVLEGGERVTAGGEGPVHYVEVQWLGIHLAFQFGRVPKAVR